MPRRLEAGTYSGDLNGDEFAKAAKMGPRPEFRIRPEKKTNLFLPRSIYLLPSSLSTSLSIRQHNYANEAGNLAIGMKAELELF